MLTLGIFWVPLACVLKGESYPRVSGEEKSAPKCRMTKIPKGHYALPVKWSVYHSNPLGGSMAALQQRTPLIFSDLIPVESFEMMTCEVTLGEWLRIMEISVLQAGETNFSLPVEGVSWLDIIRYCNRLSEINDLSPAYRIDETTVLWDVSANGFRLPTEAEWRYAAMADDNYHFAGGDVPGLVANCGEGLFHSEKVANRLPNSFGLYDMSGNVAEYVWNWSSGDEERVGKIDDVNWLRYGSQYGWEKQALGGAYIGNVDSCSINYEPIVSPGIERGAPTIGFRLVRGSHIRIRDGIVVSSLVK